MSEMVKANTTLRFLDLRREGEETERNGNERSDE